MKKELFMLSFLSFFYVLGNNHQKEHPIKHPINVILNTQKMMRLKVPNIIKKEKTSSKKYMMIVYVDINDCPLCFISHLYEWEIFMKECKENEIPLSFSYIFSPPETGDIIFKNMLSSSSISHLAYIDVKNEFRKKNQWLINNPSKHIFIIDKEKKPIFMEAPPYNKDIMMWLRNL